MTGLQIAAAVVVCADIGIVFAALLWPDSHENEQSDHRTAILVTALPSGRGEPARPRHGPGRTRLVRAFLGSLCAYAQRHVRRHSM
jgi:hypothetical protein